MHGRLIAASGRDGPRQLADLGLRPKSQNRAQPLIPGTFELDDEVGRERGAEGRSPSDPRLTATTSAFKLKAHTFACFDTFGVETANEFALSVNASAVSVRLGSSGLPNLRLGRPKDRVFTSTASAFPLKAH